MSIFYLGGEKGYMSSKETIIKATVQVGMDISDVQSNAKAIQNALKNFKMPAGLEE